MGNRVGALRGASLWLFEARGLALPRSLAPAGRISSPARLGGLLDIDWICFDGLDVRLSQLGVGPAVRQEQDASEHY